MDIETTQQSWALRFIKGMFIGSGFIVPGISGGALAAIFGMYEYIINFLADITKQFWANVKFFIPVGFGALAGIAILSWGVSYLLGNFETVVRWFFVGAVLGTAPALWRQAGQEGRQQGDYIALILSFLIGVGILFFGQELITASLAPSFGAWVLCGMLIALGVLVPGMSPSNFILYLGLYQAMADGFKKLDLSVVIPIGIGGLLTVVLFAKLIQKILLRYYSAFYHAIIGLVAASTLMIIPTDYHNFTLIQYILCIVMIFLGALLGWWMVQLESKYQA